jgi:hypothetical protein
MMTMIATKKFVILIAPMEVQIVMLSDRFNFKNIANPGIIVKTGQVRLFSLTQKQQRC